MLVTFGIHLGNKFPTSLYLGHEDIKRFREKSQDTLPRIWRNRGDSWDGNVRAASICMSDSFVLIPRARRGSPFPLWRLRLSPLAERVIANETVSGIFDRSSVWGDLGVARSGRSGGPDGGINPQRDILAALIETLIKSREDRDGTCTLISELRHAIFLRACTTRSCALLNWRFNFHWHRNYELQRRDRDQTALTRSSSRACCARWIPPRRRFFLASRLVSLERWRENDNGRTVSF